MQMRSELIFDEVNEGKYRSFRIVHLQRNGGQHSFESNPNFSSSFLGE